MFKIVNCQLVRLKNSFNHSKRWKPLACQLSTVLYKSVIKKQETKGICHFCSTFSFLASNGWLLRLQASASFLRASRSPERRRWFLGFPPLLLCSSAPTLLLLLGLWRSVRCSPQWWQHPVEIGGAALRKVKIDYFTFSFLTLLIRENILGSGQKTNVSQRCTKKSFLILTISWKKSRMLLKEMKHLSDFNLQRYNLHNCIKKVLVAWLM